MGLNLTWFDIKKGRAMLYLGIFVTMLLVSFAYPSFYDLAYPFDNKSAFYLHPNVDANVPPGHITVPIELFVLNSENNVVSYNDVDLVEMIGWANQVWTDNADISFELRGIHRLLIPDDRAEPSLSDEEVIALANDFLGQKFNDNVIDVLVVKSIKNVEEGAGKAVPSVKSLMISDVDNAIWARWTLTHELGHLVNLGDVVQKDNLMQWNQFSGNVEYKKENFPTGLTREQALTARDWVYKTWH